MVFLGFLSASDYNFERKTFLEFWDCDLRYGPDTLKEYVRGCAHIEDLEAQLERAGIRGVITWSTKI